MKHWNHSKGIEEPDQSVVEATGPGLSGYIGTLGRIRLCKPTDGPGASLKELQLKGILCDPQLYPNNLDEVYQKE